MNKTKCLSRVFIVPALCASLLLAPPLSVRAEVYYQKVQKDTIGRGITYESVKSVTDKGMLDVYVLKVPLNDPYITVKPVQSTKESELKESTTSILSGNGAIAGVNGDFFNMSGSYSSVIGPMVEDGRIRAIDRFNNMDKNAYATFFIGKDGSPFIDYVKSEIVFTNDGVENIKVFAINKITDMVYSTLVDHEFMADTAAVDQKFPGLAKIVVENGVITKVTQKGETVTVPENGYVVLISEASADYFTTLVKVGQTANVSVKAKVDFTAVEQAIGGAGKLLENGQAASDGGHVPSGSQPRTAVGYDQAKQNLILMVVDGRTHSIGATHQQMAELMLQYGAYNAMHLDGGGSSTMGVRKPGGDTIEVMNTPSEGTQRRVANALGVFSEAPLGEPTSMNIKPLKEWGFVGAGLPMNIYASDDYFNVVMSDPATMNVQFSDPGAFYSEGYYYAKNPGKAVVTAFYYNLNAQAEVEAKTLAQIIPSQSKINAGVGGQTTLSFTGVATDSATASIEKGVFCQVTPPTLGHMDGYTFVADQMGAGYITCSVGNITCYVDVNVGYQTTPVTGFEASDPSVSFVSSPEGLVGKAGYTQQTVASGANALTMTYQLQASDQTQAAYLKFNEPIALPNGTMSFKLNVFGDNSYYWLRAKLIDGNGAEQTVDLAKEVNWVGWKELTATLPSGIKQPVKLERIYAASLNNVDTNTYTLGFDDLVCNVLVQYPALAHGEDSVFIDTKKADLSVPPATGFDLTLTGDIAYGGDEEAPGSPKADMNAYKAAQNKVIEKAKQHTTRILFAGASDIKDDIGVKYFNWNQNYELKDQNGVLIVQLTAAEGGITATDATQWGKFPKDLTAAAQPVVIIEIDKNPMNFKYAKEFELFAGVMEELAKAGKQVFVVSSEGTSDWSKVRNGVHYINIGGLWKEGGKANDAVSVLRLRITSDGATYEFQPVN